MQAERADFHVQTERERIALQIQAVVAPYRDHLIADHAGSWDGYRMRACSLLDGLEAAARPFPDLRGSLSAARAELAIE